MTSINSLSYNDQRNIYYLGILALVLHAIPTLPFVNYLMPVFDYKLFPNLPVISIIAMIVLAFAILAYKYRRIG